MHDYTESGEINSDMARAQLMKIANYGKAMFNSLKPDDQLPDWVKSKITAASEHMGAVKHWMDYEMEGDMPLAKRGKEIRPGKVGKVMREFKEGRLYSSSGEKVTDRKQAIAIAMSEAGMSRKMAKGGPASNIDMEVDGYSKDFGCLSWFTGTSLCYITKGYRLTVPQLKAKSDSFIGRLQKEFYQKMYYEKMDSPKSWEAIKSQMLEYAEKHRGDKIRLRFADGGEVKSINKKIDQAIASKKTLRLHNKWEDENMHTENALLIAKTVGSREDIKVAQEILKNKFDDTSVSDDDYEKRRELVIRLWPKFYENAKMIQFGKKMEDGGKILSNKEIIKDLEFEDQTDRKHGMYSFSFHTEDSEGAIILDYDGNIVVAPAESRAPDELDWGQNVPEDWETAEDYIFDKFYEWLWSKNKKMADGGETSRIKRATYFAKDFIAKHPEHKDAVIDLYQLMKDEISDNGSVEHEIDSFISSCNDLLEEYEDGGGVETKWMIRDSNGKHASRTLSGNLVWYESPDMSYLYSKEDAEILKNYMEEKQGYSGLEVVEYKKSNSYFEDGGSMGEVKEQKSDYPFVVEVMYRDGANYKDFFTFGISEEQSKAIAIGDEVRSDFFGISEKTWYDEYLPGDYDPEYDHNTLEVEMVRPRKETDVLSNK